MDQKAPAATPQQAPAAANPAPNKNAKSVSSYISNPLEFYKPSWDAIRPNLGSLILLGLVVLGVIVAIGLVDVLVFLAVAKAGVGFTLFLVTALLGLIGLVAIAAFIPVSTVAILESAKGNKITVSGVLSESFQYSLPMIGTIILTALAVIGGLILFIIPGLIFAAWFSLASYAVVAEKKGPVDAMKRSKQLVKGHVWEQFGLMSLYSAFSILNIIPILGQLVLLGLSVVYAAAPAIRYLQLVQVKDHNAPAPGTHWVNYAVLVVAFVANGITSTLNSNKTTPDTTIPTYTNTTY